MILIERVTTLKQEEVLLIHSINKGTRIYEWVSEIWEPAEAAKVAEIIMSRKACIRGILLSEVCNGELLC